MNPDPTFNIVTIVIAIVSLGISIWNRIVEDKNSKIDITSNFIRKGLESISCDEHIFLKKDLEKLLEEQLNLRCVEMKLSYSDAEKYKKGRLDYHNNHLPEMKEELVSSILQFYRSIKFFIENSKIDEKMLAILLQNKIESHFEILKKALINEKIFPSNKLKKQDLLDYLEDITFVISKILKTKFYTPVMESRIEQQKNKLEEYKLENKGY